MKTITLAVVCLLCLHATGFSQNNLIVRPGIVLEKSLFPVSEYDEYGPKDIYQYIFPGKLNVELYRKENSKTKIRESVLTVHMKTEIQIL